MLVAMLALLPNAIWGLTETTETNISNGSSFTLSVTTLSKYVKGSDYWALSVIEPDGTIVDDLSAWTVSQNGFNDHSKSGQYLKVNKTGYDLTYQFLTLTAPSTISSLAHYKIILWVSKNEAFYNNPSEVLAEKKVTFDIISKDELPTFKTYFGPNSAEKLVTVADANLQGGSISITDLGETLADFAIWDKNADSNGLILSKYPFYLRLSVVDKDGNPVTDLSGFTLKRNGNIISDTQLGDHEWNLACYKNAKGVYCLRDKKEGAFVSFSDLNFTISCPSDKNINDYNVVVYVGNEQPSFSGNLIMEEPTLVGKVNYTILSQTTFDAIKLTPSVEPTGAAVRNVSSIVLGTNLNVDLTSKDNLKFIKEQLGLSETQNFGKLYVRWAIKKKDGSAITGVSSKGALKQQEGMYWTWYSDDASSSFANALNAHFVVPEGLDINDVDISCVISDETPTTQYGFVTIEPTLKAKVNVQLLDKYSMPFNHYVGHANTALDEKGMQQTAEWEYYVYVKDANEKVELVLPFDKYENSGDPLEPQGYFRWYNFTKDIASDNLTPNTETGTTFLNHIKSGSNDYGLFAYKLTAPPTSSNIGVTYTAPAGASSDEWAGEDIACDVSRYIDGLDATKTYLVHEPTLSIRYIFHIRSAKQLADDIMNTAIGKNTQREGYRTYEDGKYLTVGMKDQSSIVTLRLDLSDATKYYFHPLVNGVYKTGTTTDGTTIYGFTHRVYYADEKDKLVESDFDVTKLCKATKIEWWAYDKNKTYCLKLNDFGNESSRFFNLTMGKLNDKWMPASMTGSTKNYTFTYGDPVYIVAYAMDDDGNRCPIANFDVRFMNNHPMTKDEIVKAGLNNRLISYLDEHYKMATKPITFDDDDVEQTVAAPTTPDNNQDRLPSKWNRRAYSFVYRDLIDYDATNFNGFKTIGHSPLHGDYCLYKSANVPGISGAGSSQTNGYLWWDGGKLYDKTYEMTNGSQYGHFLYVDASDESRKIAASDFTADLCTGQQLIFIAGIANMTDKTKPQIMFKLYGVKRNVNGDIVDKHLIHSFSSGDFTTNVESLESATWYQVYGKITLQKESNVEQYSDFRLEIDNYCSNTDGADYAVDDIRMYLAPAKVQVIQEKPICDGAATGNIKLKIRAIHETLNAITGHKGQTKIYFRFVDEEGKPVEGIDESNPYYRTELVNTSDGTKIEYKSNKYGTVDVFDSEGTCNQYTIDDTPMIEKDSEGETYIVISNRYYPLKVGKKYYVSVATETPDATGNSNWGSPAEVCSLYSSWFEMVSQHPIITDTYGNVITDYKIPCDQADNYSVNIKGQLVTTDPNTGGKITLDNVEFLWYIDDPAVASNKLNETASNTITISKEKLPLGEIHKIFMLPKGTPNADGYIPYEINGKTYLLCTSAIPVPLRVMKDGPQLNFGFNNVDYPFKDNSYEASLRIGLPQIKKLLEKTSQGFLQVPLHSASYKTGVTDKTLTFIDDSKTGADKTSVDVYVATTNDPLWDASLLKKPVAKLSSSTLSEIVPDVQSTLDLKFSDAAVENFHEGYYYELRFAFEQKAVATGGTSCPGESYLKVKIVPEFITWYPTADGGMNANWNNDDNWHRSSSTELYDDKYEDYQAYGNASGITAKVNIPTLNSYVPMKFTKVTIDNLKGLPFPDLGNIVYRSTNKIATQLTNGKGNEATKYIQYDIMAFWDEAATDKGLESGNLKCEKFYGNTCHQIYFKPQGELRDQCYLIYDKAWVEKELVPNKWYTMASPLQYIYAGDMYVPAKDGRQETKAFEDITFDTNVYSRSKYPVYQRAWMKSDVKEITPKSDYPASHYPSVAAPENVDMNLGYWSHVYNKVDESYADAADGTFGGFSIKAGNALLPKDQTKKALLRLPKADTSYQYFDYNGTGNSSSETSVTKDPKGRGRLLVAFNNDEKHLAEKTQSLGTDNNSGFYLVANPYTCSISMAKFFEANTGLQKAIWMVENGEVKAISNAELDKQNYAIQPTQSFFVKKKEGEMVENVRFTSTMCIDRTITPGLRMASDYVKSIEATTENSNGQISKARIALRPEASADYDDQEDVDLLYDQNLKDVPQVYTVAGNEAVAVNAVPELSWIPLGIVSQQAEEVSLTLKGVNKLDAPVYLYDAASASFTELHDGEAVKVKAGDHGRYFLTQTRTSTGIDRMEAEEQSAPVKVYSPAAGMIVVSALGGEKLDRVQVFTLDGKMVHSYQLPDKQRMILRVPSGIYIVKASTQSCAQAKGQKIAVR
ncbi:T9SS type A sorting domain-containing protein [Segatella copri]|uniref:T9SS type A sorting domain-containing protein n=1 Tax=Segatella copri TaxID=165179 RepID=UPI001C2CAC06|nr:T9SS type A sorting domain-containing protein [Segatella copri]MBV3374346.1 T9SS type A sorting domain-containing protein [Segatella copri]